MGELTRANKVENKVESFRSIARLISDAASVTSTQKKKPRAGYLANPRSLSKEKRNHANSARLTVEQWPAVRGFRKFAATTQ